MLPLTRPAARAALATLALTTAVTALTVTQPRPDAAAAASPVAGTSAAAENRARRAFAAMPLSFEANRGQVDAEVDYLARGDGFTLFLTQQGAVFDMRAPESRSGAAERSAPAAAVVLDPVGARSRPRLEGRRQQRATSSYFLGDDPGQWRRGVPTFGRIRYRDLYPGIDMVFRGNRSGAEYDFVVAPGSDPARIGYRLRGADAVRLEDGDLVATTAVGDFVHHAPITYQVVDGQRRAVESRFRLVDGVVGFDLGSYDQTLPLIIDPETDVDYATYLGGSGRENGAAIAVDGGDVYVTGYTESPDFPTTAGAYDTTRSAASDVFLTRISPDGAGSADLVYSALLGGDGPAPLDDVGLGLTVAGGDAYLTGSTASADFPTTAGAFDTSLAGDRDAFLVRISPDAAGAADLGYSTFLGGSGSETASAIAVQGGDAYLTGSTSGAGFPLTPGAYDTTATGGDAFVTRISPDGGGAADLVYSTLLGGGGQDTGRSIAVAAGDAYVTGETTSTNFPTTAGAYDRTANGLDDAFVARLSPDGAGPADLVYATLLGGGRNETGRGIAVDGSDVYVTGRTSSTGFPTTDGAHDPSYNGDGDAYLARISPAGAGQADLTYATFLGGGLGDEGQGIAVDAGDAYVLATAGIDDKYGGSSVLVARISPDGGGAADLLHTSNLGIEDTRAGGIAVAGGTAYVTGTTYDEFFDLTPGAYDTVLGGVSDAFVSAIDLSTDEWVWPDGLIRRANRPDHGDDLYYGQGDQTVSARVRRGDRRVFWITAQNDDNAPDSLTITAAGGAAARWVIRYYRAGVDITDQVSADGYQTQNLAPGEQELIKLTIKARATARLNRVKRVPVVLRSTSAPAFYDRVEAAVTAKRR